MKVPYFRLVYPFILIVFCFIGCEHAIAPEEGLFFVGQLNEVMWRGESEAEIYEDGRLVVWGLRQYRPGDVDDIVIEVEFHGAGRYSIQPGNAHLRRIYSYDMGFLQGISFGSNEDQLVITKYDERENIVEGNCRLKLKGMNGYKDMTFTNGWFRAKVRGGY